MCPSIWKVLERFLSLTKVYCVNSTLCPNLHFDDIHKCVKPLWHLPTRTMSTRSFLSVFDTWSHIQSYELRCNPGLCWSWVQISLVWERATIAWAQTMLEYGTVWKVVIICTIVVIYTVCHLWFLCFWRIWRYLQIVLDSGRFFQAYGGFGKMSLEV